MIDEHSKTIPAPSRNNESARVPESTPVLWQSLQGESALHHGTIIQRTSFGLTMHVKAEETPAVGTRFNYRRRNHGEWVGPLDVVETSQAPEGRTLVQAEYQAS